MTRLFLSWTISILIYQQVSAQTLINGYVLNSENKPLESVSIQLGEDLSIQETSDSTGYFQFENISPGDYQINFSKTGYTPVSFEFIISLDKQTKHLGNIVLEYNPSQINSSLSPLTDNDLSTKKRSNEQTAINLLLSSRDIYSKVASSELGSYNFRIRGAESSYNNIMFNGIPMTKSRNGKPDFGNWGGLNSVTKHSVESSISNMVSDFSFSNLGGTNYYDTKASNYKKELDVSYSLTNRSYLHRIMANYSTGMLPSGWAFSFSGSRRWMNEGIIDGTYIDAYAYFASIEKKISDTHRLSFTTFGTPTRKSGSSANTQEVYDLRNIKYNPDWGWQNGKKRNGKISKSYEPIFMFSHYWDINYKTELTSTVSYQFGHNTGYNLNKYESFNPSPTYYRNLPSYWIYKGNYFQTEYLKNAWENNDQSITQINWGNLYFANKNAPTYTDTYTGITGKRASYFINKDVIKDNIFNAATHLRTQINNNWNLYLNLNYLNNKSIIYREIYDLMGADFVINRNPFIRGDRSDASAGDYNILKPRSVSREGEKSEFDYNLYRQAVTLNASTKVNINHMTLRVSTLLGWNESYREGKFMHGSFPESSYGKSNKKDLAQTGLRGSLIYNFNKTNLLIFNTAYYESSPSLHEIFPSPRLNNYITPNIKNQNNITNDISYIIKSSKFHARITGYYNEIKNATKVSQYYIEEIELSSTINSNDAFVSEILSGVKQVYAGGEFAAEWKISSIFTVAALASINKYTYRNNPNLKIISDQLPGIHNYGTAYIKNYKIAGSPQKAYSLSFRYNSPELLWIGISGNFLQDIYSNFYSFARTENFITDPRTGEIYPGVTPESVKELLKQEKHKNVFMLNINAGKTVKLGNYTLGISGAINNLLNEKNYVTNAYEQGRASTYRVLSKKKYFANKLNYDLGRAYSINVFFKF